MDPTTVAISGVPLIVLIITLIQALKRAFPDAPGNLWFGLSMAFGAAGQVVVHLSENPVPTTVSEWSALFVLGVMVGLAAGKAYDQTIGREEPRDALRETVDELNALNLQIVAEAVRQRVESFNARARVAVRPGLLPGEEPSDD